jgi:superfamily II DNA or RNA helicase
VLRLRLNEDEQRQYDHARATFREVYDRYRAVVPTGTWRDFAMVAARSPEGRSALTAFSASRRLTSYPESKRTAVGTLLQQHCEQRVLVFTSDNASAYAISRDHLIMPITCDISARERQAALSAFRSGDLRALVSAQVLNEGIDVPAAEIGIVVGGVRGRREHVQRVGRLLRPAPNKRAVVYDLVIRGTHEARAARQREHALRGKDGRRA